MRIIVEIILIECHHTGIAGASTSSMQDVLRRNMRASIMIVSSVGAVAFLCFAVFATGEIYGSVFHRLIPSNIRKLFSLLAFVNSVCNSFPSDGRTHLFVFNSLAIRVDVRLLFFSEIIADHLLV